MLEKSYTLHAKSSSGEPYAVVFEFFDGKVKVLCACAAGALFQMCKHKKGFLCGDGEFLFDEEQIETLKEIAAQVEQTQFSAEFYILEKELNEIEIEKKNLSKRTSELKSAFARRLSAGI